MGVGLSEHRPGALTRGRRPGPEPPLPRPGAVISTVGNLDVCAFGRASGSGLDASDRTRRRAPLGSDRHLAPARAPGFPPRHPLRRPRERQGAALQGCSGWRNLGSRRCRLWAVSRSRDVFTGGGGSNRRGRAHVISLYPPIVRPSVAGHLHRSDASLLIHRVAALTRTENQLEANGQSFLFLSCKYWSRASAIMYRTATGIE